MIESSTFAKYLLLRSILNKKGKQNSHNAEYEYEYCRIVPITSLIKCLVVMLPADDLTEHITP